MSGNTLTLRVKFAFRKPRLFAYELKGVQRVQEVTGLVHVHQCFRKFRWRTAFIFEKQTTYPHSLAHVEFPDDSYPKSQIYIAELILDSYEYVP